MRKKIRYNKSNRYIAGWVKTKIKAKTFKTLEATVRNLFKDDYNYQNVLEKISNQNPGIFESNEGVRGALYGKKDKESIIKFITFHANSQKKQMQKKNPDVTNEEVLNSYFNTRTYVSREEIAVNNMRKFLKKRDDESRLFADELRRQLGVNRLDYSKLRYSNNISYTYEDEFGNTKIQNGAKGYVFEGSNTAITVTGSGSQASPYHFELHINKSTSI